MPKRAKALTDTAIRKKKVGTHAVGGVAGLLLVVRPSQAKDSDDNDLVRSWVLRYATGETRISEKTGKPYAVRRDFGLGAYPDVPLKDARDAARDAREMLRQGKDPVTEKQAARAAMTAALSKRMTFEEAARKCHAAKSPEFRNAKHSKNWIASLNNHVFPVIGSVQVAEIDVHHIMKVLQPIWEEKTETATRIRQRMEAALAWATVSGFRQGDNPARLKENLDQLLPKANKVRNKKHFPALPYVCMGEFMAELRKREGVGARALEFAIFTAARSNEVRKAEWKEFDLAAKLWTVPGERMKSGKSHRVPLSNAAMAVLKSQPKLSDFVFSNSKGNPVSDATLLATVKRMHDDDVAVGGEGWTDATDGRRIVPHGFRSAFKDWARNVATKYRDEVSELALAHVNDDKTRAAYARDELIPRRTPMMDDWARYCCQPIKPGKVSKLERRA